MRLHWLVNYNFLSFSKIDSTNDEAVRISESGISGNFVILSNLQTKGKGTKGRDWESRAGDLTFSILLQNFIPVKNHFHINFIIANVIFDVLNEIFISYNLQHKIELKWANDIIVNNKKIGGILIKFITKGKNNFCIIGIGINILKVKSNLCNFAISLNELGVTINKDILLDKIITRFDMEIDDYISQGEKFSKIKNLWLKRAYKLGEFVHIWDGSQNISGLFSTLNNDGSIKLEISKNRFKNILFGDIYDHYLYK
ncbi:MAG: biotin--[acetyl-CoA-carboxylase] ligase [Rickettsia sp.]|nr:biotin--[acetyl-CoA-carboxylase] ligase [Rickettsia sp.]